MSKHYADLTVDERSIVCSAHFHPDSYHSDLQKRLLKKDAIPTIFKRRNFESHSKKKKRQLVKSVTTGGGKSVKADNVVLPNVGVDLSKDKAAIHRLAVKFRLLFYC
jgi:hypothetical protein